MHTKRIFWKGRSRKYMNKNKWTDNIFWDVMAWGGHVDSSLPLHPSISVCLDFMWLYALLHLHWLMESYCNVYLIVLRFCRLHGSFPESQVKYPILLMRLQSYEASSLTTMPSNGRTVFCVFPFLWNLCFPSSTLADVIRCYRVRVGYRCYILKCWQSKSGSDSNRE